jgi:hypothetical protein
MSAKIWHDPHPAVGHSGNDLEPAAPALCEPVQKRDRRALAAHEVAQSDALTIENHMQIVWM